MSNAIDNLERALEHKLLKQLYGKEQAAPAGCCLTPCKLSEGHERAPGTVLCKTCAQLIMEIV